MAAMKCDILNGSRNLVFLYQGKNLLVNRREPNRGGQGAGAHGVERQREQGSINLEEISKGVTADF